MPNSKRKRLPVMYRVASSCHKTVKSIKKGELVNMTVTDTVFHNKVALWKG